MGLRPVQILEQGTDDTIRVNHLIGVDESGNPTAGTPYVVAAVQCPRESSELLAELLIEAELGPWQRKSKSLGVVADSQAERTDRVRRFIQLLDASTCTWCAAAGWDTYSPADRSAIACRVAKGTLTLPAQSDVVSCFGDTLVLHDGGHDVYHPDLRPLRVQASSMFDSSFEAEFSPIYVGAFSKADLTYPEVTAADFIAGYVRHRISSDSVSIEACHENVSRIDVPNWRNPTSLSPKPLYEIKHGTRREKTTIQTRVVAWLDGRQPSTEDGFDTDLFDEFVDNRLDSELIQTYLRRMSS